ncbi:diacylglycerol/lipid kinase family protein [Caproiciproducens sp. LBM24188]|nr:YegS/Rv2252/BmrU family lipid kinase [Clostridiales bacterium]
MRYIFIINPTAGKRNPYQTVFPQIASYCRQQGIEYTVHITAQPRQATELTRQHGSKGDAVRVYAIGGDGTLSEVAAGAFGMPNVEVGAIPCGSGNDYVKTFGAAEDFLSPEKQIHAASRWVDMIESNGQRSLNESSVGLDAKVGMESERLKRILSMGKFVNGPAIYKTALVKTLFGPLENHLRICIDGTYFEGNYLFAIAASGKYYGGGFCCAPSAVPDDGLLDFILIQKPPLLRIPARVALFREGKHLTSPKFNGLLTFRRGKRMSVEADRPVAANFDGEYRLIQKESFQVLPRAIRFLLPCDSCFFNKNCK